MLQVATRLGLPYHTCRRLALRGALGPLERIAGRFLLDPDAVQRYADERAKSAASTPLATEDAPHVA